MKGYGLCALFITISDFRGPPKQILPLLIILKNKIKLKKNPKKTQQIKKTKLSLQLFLLQTLIV
jgi:hypothetical protein